MHKNTVHILVIMLIEIITIVVYNSITVYDNRKKHIAWKDVWQKWKKWLFALLQFYFYAPAKRAFPLQAIQAAFPKAQAFPMIQAVCPKANLSAKRRNSPTSKRRAVNH